MKASKKRLTAALLALVVLLILVTPALADPKAVVGERINIMSGEPGEYLAGEPFHIWHALCLEVAQGDPIAAGKMGFALEINGKPVERDFKFAYVSTPLYGGPNCVGSGAVFNFPEGLPSGTYTFTGHWYSACISTEGPCENPWEPVDWNTKDLTVTFR